MKILYAEDNHDIHELMKDYLTEQGHYVVSFFNGACALKHLDACINEDYSMPDLILSDIQMPVMDGKAFIAALKARDASKHLPVIFHSGEINPQIEGTSFVDKPDIGKVFEMIDLLNKNF